MNANQCDIGLIGLGAMGKISSPTWNRRPPSLCESTTEITEKSVADAPRENIQPTQ
jgi:hypothetical protein